MTIAQQIALLIKKVALLINSRLVSTNGEKIYKAASVSLGKHCTLDNTIPAEVGCAEAVSYVLAKAGISDGPKGIAGTASLDAWLASSGLFERITMPEEGAIICSPTGAGNGTVEGHVGVFGRYNLMYPGDWGVCSNESSSGLFKEQWSWARWQAYYGKTGGLPLHIYRAI